MMLRYLICTCIAAVGAWTGLVLALPMGCTLPNHDDPYLSSYEHRTRLADYYQEACSVIPKGIKLHIRLQPYQYDLISRASGLKDPASYGTCGI